MLLLDTFGQSFHDTGKGIVTLALLADCLDRVDNGTVVAVAKMQTNYLQRAFGQPLGQEHGYLTGRRYLLLAGFANEEFLCKAEVIGDHLLDTRNRSEERRVGKEGRSRWSPYH